MWNTDKTYFQGVSRTVVYKNNVGTEWIGVASITSEEENYAAKTIYVDGEGQSVSLVSTTFEAEVTSYTIPDDIDKSIFDMTYRVESGDSDYEIHFIYGCRATMGEISRYTINEDPEALTYTVYVSTLSDYAKMLDYAPRSHLIIRSKDIDSEIITDLENILYGDDSSEPHLPTQEELVEFLESRATLRIIDHGDGTWTAIGPDDAIKLLSATEFQITWPSAKILDVDSYLISSL